MREPGKKFELDFANSIKPLEDIFGYRIKTRATRYKGDSEIGDFFVFRTPSLFVLELKSTKEKRLPFDMIRLSQIEGLMGAIKTKGVYGGVLLQMREPEYLHFYIPIDVIYDYIEKGAKSIPLVDLKSHPMIINVAFTKKRVSVSLDVRTLLSAIEGSTNEHYR